MKVRGLHGLRGKQLLLILVIICTMFLIWGWEKTPHQVTSILSPEAIYLPLPVARPTYIHQHVTTQEEFPVADNFGHPTSEKEKKSLGVPSKGSKTTSSYKVTEVKKKDTTVALLDKKDEDLPFEKAEQVLKVPPKGSAITSPVNLTEVDKNLKMTSLEKKECNYGKGKWIKDDRHPLYSGFGCKQWLSAMWACRLTTRTDFSSEKYRWQPVACEMPEFEGSEFLRRMQDKTVAFVGDSLGRQQFQSLMCMVTSGEESPEVEDVGMEYGFGKAQGDERPSGWAYRFPRTRTTILYHWSSTLCELEPLNVSDPATGYAMHLDRPASFLKQNLHRFDVLVLNTGHHWNRGKLTANRWEFYVGGVPNTNRRLREMGRAKNLTIHTVVKWLDSQLPQHPQLKAFLRSISPRHFFNGEWNTGGSCDSTRPLAHGYEVLQDTSADPVAAAAVSGTRVKLLDVTALSQLRDEAHISRYSFKAAEGVHDCLHWCLPGIPDTWNEILAAQI